MARTGKTVKVSKPPIYSVLTHFISSPLWIHFWLRTIRRKILRWYLQKQGLKTVGHGKVSKTFFFFFCKSVSGLVMQRKENSYWRKSPHSFLLYLVIRNGPFFGLIYWFPQHFSGEGSVSWTGKLFKPFWVIICSLLENLSQMKSLEFTHSRISSFMHHFLSIVKEMGVIPQKQSVN